MDPCRLGAFPGVLYKRFEQIELPVNPATKVPRWEIASYLCGACKHVSEFLMLPSRLCSAFRVVDYLLRFHSQTPQKVSVFQVPPVGQEYFECQPNVIGCMRCGSSAQVGSGAAGSSQSGQQEVVAVLQRQESPFGTFNPRTSGTGRLSNLPMRWSCPACGPRRESGNCPCGDRRKISILDVSHFLGRGQSKREFHKELIHSFMEPCAVCWILIHQVRAPPPQWAELEVPFEAAVRDRAPCGRS